MHKYLFLLPIVLLACNGTEENAEEENALLTDSLVHKKEIVDALEHTKMAASDLVFLRYIVCPNDMYDITFDLLNDSTFILRYESTNWFDESEEPSVTRESFTGTWTLRETQVEFSFDAGSAHHQMVSRINGTEKFSVRKQAGNIYCFPLNSDRLDIWGICCEKDITLSKK